MCLFYNFVWLFNNNLLYLGIIKNNKNMKKFEKVVKVKSFENEKNELYKFIFGELEGLLSGDWSDYKGGEEVCYKINLDDENEFDKEYWEENGLSVDEIKEFIGEGICFEDDICSEYFESEIWYNVSFEGNVLKYEYVVVNEK
jgi:hypothetical protein